jgi:hypothetical protein
VYFVGPLMHTACARCAQVPSAGSRLVQSGDCARRRRVEEKCLRPPGGGILAAMRSVRVVLLIALLAGCTSGQEPNPGDEPRRYADYTTPATVDAQCSLPVEQRTGGWFCYEPEPTPAP